MNKERDSYYFILGLQPGGASPEEIKSAFCDLTKLYHPDHDKSLDAEMKYKKIRAAYDTTPPSFVCDTKICYKM